jgi:uncharacterized protein (TIGR03067 family)
MLKRIWIKTACLTLATLGIWSGTPRASDAKTSPEDRREAAKKDLEKLQGVWIMTAMETEGHVLTPEDFEGRNSLYEGDSLSLRAGETVRRRGIVTLDPTRTPKAMNTWDADGPYADQTLPGIYELDGDNLKVCFARPGEPRPTKFSSNKEGGGFLVAVYKRKKP